MRTSSEQARAIFGNPPPPRKVTERQFDYHDEDLQRIGRTPWQQIERQDLWYYIHDLAYMELQPDLFVYLFPVCLMFWRETLLENRYCGVGDAHFHYALIRGNILERMVTPEQRRRIYFFFIDSFLDRLDEERGFVYVGSETPAYSWMAKLSTLGIIMPEIATLWQRWWSFETPGHAVAALQYASGLIYREGENPIFRPWTAEEGGGGPYLSSSECDVLRKCWLPENFRFLRDTFTPEYLAGKMAEAADRLRDEPEAATAYRIREDYPSRKGQAEARIAELLRQLEEGGRL